MEKFRRCLRKEAELALDELTKSPGDNWWKELLRLWAPSGHGDGLRLAIRRHTIDIYRHGNRVAHVGFGQGKAGVPARAWVETHIKYVRGENAGVRQLRLEKSAVGEWKWNDGGTSVDFTEIQTYIDRRMISLRSGNGQRKGLEKRGVDLIAGNNGTVIDLEMGLSPDPTILSDGTGAPRMDLISLESQSSGIHLVFWEAKTFDDSRLRIDRDDELPEALNQLRAYRDYLSSNDRCAEIIEAYEETCRLLVRFWRMRGETSSLDPLVERIARGEALKIDRHPRLIIFSTPKGKIIASDKSWLRHEAKIRTNVDCLIEQLPEDVKLTSEVNRTGEK